MLIPIPDFVFNYISKYYSSASCFIEVSLVLSPPSIMQQLFILDTKFTFNQVGLKLNGTHQLMVYADDVNLLGDNIDTIKKNMETLIDASKEVGLEVNTEKTKYMLLSRHQNAGQNFDIKIVSIFRKMWQSSYIWERL
jgi:hypothetical protein